MRICIPNEEFQDLKYFMGYRNADYYFDLISSWNEAKKMKRGVGCIERRRIISQHCQHIFLLNKMILEFDPELGHFSWKARKRYLTVTEYTLLCVNV